MKIIKIALQGSIARKLQPNREYRKKISNAAQIKSNKSTAAPRDLCNQHPESWSDINYYWQVFGHKKTEKKWLEGRWGENECHRPKPDYPQGLGSKLLHLFFYAEVFQAGCCVSYDLQHFFLAYLFEGRIKGVRTYNVHTGLD